ncbi:hypothetical protein BCD64_02890 [Nostoc sp. MBR 210]|nr:hypothetical protein BCD64_02890 [Nostoc sp. MBR 210]
MFTKKLLPCTQEQVCCLEQRFGLTFPVAYQEFLLWGGICAGGLFEGSNCFYKSLPELRQGAEELLNRDEFPELLPEDAFVFLIHQGYIFWFFRTSEGDDPPVYGYEEGAAPIPYTSVPFKKLSSSFSKFLAELLEEEVGVRKRLQE